MTKSRKGSEHLPNTFSRHGLSAGNKPEKRLFKSLPNRGTVKTPGFDYEQTRFKIGLDNEPEGCLE